MNLNTVRIFVRDLTQARQFYEHAVGLTLKADGVNYGYCVFQAGSAELVVETVGDDAPDEEQVLVGRFTGLSFAVDDVLAKYEELTARGVVFTGTPEVQAWGGTLATFRDPAGNELQMAQHPAA